MIRLDILLLYDPKLKPCMQKNGSSLLDMMIHILFLFAEKYKLMA